jgi:hypothetical protein
MDDEEARVDSGFLILTAAEIKDIFEPVVKEVCDLVQGQVDGLRNKGGIVSGIVLVGGFGQSEYLYKRLKGHFTSGAPPPYSERPTHAMARAIGENGSIEVMQPLYAWTAVVRGAVLRGLEGSMVISRKARMHYGTSYATVYDEEKHSVSERYWSPLWERWMVSDRMQWHIAKVRLLHVCTHASQYPYCALQWHHDSTNRNTCPRPVVLVHLPWLHVQKRIYVLT